MPNFCKCGCGAEVALGKTWVRGHHLKKSVVQSAIHVIPGITKEQLEEALIKGPNLKVHIFPHFGDQDKGDGGIRRVVEAQIKHLPKYGIEIVDTAAEADVIAYHAECPQSYINLYPQKTFVACCHGVYWQEYQWDNWSIKANEKVFEGIRVADATITCSEWVANSLRRHLSRDVNVIYHGVDAEDWGNPYQPQEYVLWNKTRPDPVCDPTPLNQLAAMLPKVNFISTFGADFPNIAKTGKLPYEDAKKLIMQAGVYLCTTRETFGIGTLEALACGVPIVGFDFGGQAEFIEHKVDGWLAKPGDIQGLADGVIWAFSNRKDITEKAKEKARAFNWDKAAEQYARIFREAYLKKQQTSPRTSIIVTNYQLHDYLFDCLESVRNQSDGDFECIIVDDASPDASGRDIARKFVKQDSRFRLVENEKNVYLAEARNVGIRMAKGRYILPLDADDMLAPNAVATLSAALDADRSIHVAYGGVLFVNEDGRSLTVYGKEFIPGHSSWPYPFTHEQQIMQRNLLPYASMYRREAWRQTGGYRRRCRTAEDADMWTRFSSYGFRPKMVTQEDTLIYRNRTTSMSRTEGDSDWIRWFSWSKVPEITPAGAATKEQLPIPSLDPIVISVIIPVGPGHDKLVTDAVDSVDCQSFRNWECIVINDTGKPLDTELPSWVRVLETEGKTGPAHARNIGIKASRGKLFLPLDADDYLEPDALQFMYDTHIRTGGDVVYSDFWQTDMEGKKVSRHNCDDYDPYLILGKKRSVNGEMREGMISSVTALTPKAAWEKIGGYDENIPGWEDWDFQIALGNIGVCSTRCPYPLFFYRKHTGYRREQNLESFEKSKQGILAKWGRFFKGEELMACGSCSARNGRNSVPAQNNMLMMNSQRIQQNSDAVLVKYTGPKQGSVGYRGNSRTMYFFGAGDTKFVLKEDLPIFAIRNDFEIVNQEPVQAPVTEPVLSAPGQA